MNVAVCSVNSRRLIQLASVAKALIFRVTFAADGEARVANCAGHNCPSW